MPETPGIEVTIKDVPAIKAVCVRKRIALKEIGSLFGELLGRLRSNPMGPAITRYFDENFDPDNVDIEILFPVKKKEDVVLPACKVASHMHVGPYESLGQAYQATFAWLNTEGAKQGYRIAGPVREVHVAGPESGKPPAQYVTEIQVPVVPISAE